MGVSHKKSKSNAAAGRPRSVQILYRSRRFALLACLLLCASFASAQQDLPQIISGERKPAHPKDTGPRALALLRLGANGKSSLVPITIRINGKFWDASVYKADPVPMALDAGTVYEVERTGSSLGLFTVGSALHSEADNAPIPWIATGQWVPAGSEQPKTVLKAENTPRGIENDDAPPRLTRANDTNSPPAKPAAAPSPSSTPPSTSSPQPASTSPTTPGSSGSAPSTSTAPSSTTAAQPADTKSADAKAAPAKPSEPPPPPSDSGADESDRPRLRYGKPAESFADANIDVPGYSKPGAKSSASASTKPGAQNKSDDLGPVQLIPAISDAAGPQPSSYKFEWYPAEEAASRKQITTLATDQLRAYLNTLAKDRISSKPASSHTRKAATSPEPILENQQMTSFDLWGSNIPVIVFSADAHLPLPPGAAAGSEPEVKYSILIVAYPDIYQNLHKLYGAVTDKYHLDVTPRLELVDAVDVDGDGRGELLFRETSDAGTGWIIYRATADKLWKLFDSLNPE
jgi:hypothetical protein